MRIYGISDEAVRKATGQGWSEWLATLDAAGAEKLSHKQIVAWVNENHQLSGWWQQTVTVAYEKARGKRVVGETADGGFQVGVQKTLPLDLEATWNLLTSKQGVACWLGKVSRFRLEEGRTYATEAGVSGEIRVIRPQKRMRLTWQPPGMKRAATLQITLMPSGAEKTSVRVHLEHLASQKAREAMKAHWRQVLAELVELVSA